MDRCGRRCGGRCPRQTLVGVGVGVGLGKEETVSKVTVEELEVGDLCVYNGMLMLKVYGDLALLELGIEDVKGHGMMVAPDMMAEKVKKVELEGYPQDWVLAVFNVKTKKVVCGTPCEEEDAAPEKVKVKGKKHHCAGPATCSCACHVKEGLIQI